MRAVLVVLLLLVLTEESQEKNNFSRADVFSYPDTKVDELFDGHRSQIPSPASINTVVSTTTKKPVNSLPGAAIGPSTNSNLTNPLPNNRQPSINGAVVVPISNNGNKEPSSSSSSDFSSSILPTAAIDLINSNAINSVAGSQQPIINITVVGPISSSSNTKPNSSSSSDFSSSILPTAAIGLINSNTINAVTNNPQPTINGTVVGVVSGVSQITTSTTNPTSLLPITSSAMNNSNSYSNATANNNTPLSTLPLSTISNPQVYTLSTPATASSQSTVTNLFSITQESTTTVTGMVTTATNPLNQAIGSENSTSRNSSTSQPPFSPGTSSNSITSSLINTISGASNSTSVLTGPQVVNATTSPQSAAISAAGITIPTGQQSSQAVSTDAVIGTQIDPNQVVTSSTSTSLAPAVGTSTVTGTATVVNKINNPTSFASLASSSSTRFTPGEVTSVMNTINSRIPLPSQVTPVNSQSQLGGNMSFVTTRPGLNTDNLNKGKVPASMLPAAGEQIGQTIGGMVGQALGELAAMNIYAHDQTSNSKLNVNNRNSNTTVASFTSSDAVKSTFNGHQ